MKKQTLIVLSLTFVSIILFSAFIKHIRADPTIIHTTPLEIVPPSHPDVIIDGTQSMSFPYVDDKIDDLKILIKLNEFTIKVLRKEIQELKKNQKEIIMKMRSK